jgi:hypothetical protein
MAGLGRINFLNFRVFITAPVIAALIFINLGV